MESKSILHARSASGLVRSFNHAQCKLEKLSGRTNLHDFSELLLSLGERFVLRFQAPLGERPQRLAFVILASAARYESLFGRIPVPVVGPAHGEEQSQTGCRTERGKPVRDAFRFEV